MIQRHFCGFLIAVVLGLLCACEPTAATDEFEVSVANAITRKCPGGQPYTIDLHGLTRFRWDTLYVFEYGMGRDEIEYVLKQRFPNYDEFTRHLVFLLDGRIVHEERTLANVEHPLQGEIQFEGASLNCWSAGDPHRREHGCVRVPSRGRFIARAAVSGRIVYFVLRQL